MACRGNMGSCLGIAGRAAEVAVTVVNNHQMIRAVHSRTMLRAISKLKSGLLIGALSFCPTAFAETAVPLPRPKPAIPHEVRSYAEAAAGLALPAEITDAASDCRIRLQTMAVIEPLPRLVGPGACGGMDMVRIKAVILGDKSQAAITPVAELRCPMAESLASWVREEVVPTLAGVHLRAVENYDSYECRGRNRVVGAKVSEHGKGNAIDIRAFRLADGRRIELTDIHADHALRDKWRESACARFTTVLGPGSDGYHEGHIHLDVIARRNGYRICQWEVRDPKPPMVAKADDKADAKSDAKSDDQAEAKPNTRPDTKLDAKPDTQVHLKAQTAPEKAPGAPSKGGARTASRDTPPSSGQQAADESHSAPTVIRPGADGRVQGSAPHIITVPATQASLNVPLPRARPVMRRKRRAPDRWRLWPFF